MTPAIEVEDLVVRYGDTVALDGASLSVGAGRVVALVGMNGSGKSTLFKALMGSVRPDRGRIRLLGQDPQQARRAGTVGHVPQAEAVDWTFPISVREVVMMGRHGRLGPLRRPRPADHDAVARALDRVGLTAWADRQIGQLPGGQRKRAFVARGIAQEAPVLLLDEPFAGVDRASEDALVQTLRDLSAAGTTVIVSTHDLAGLSALADEVVLLLRRVLFHGRVEEGLRPERIATALGLGVASGREGR